MHGCADAAVAERNPSLDGDRGSSLLIDCSVLSGDDSVEPCCELDWEFKILVRFGVGEAGAESRRRLGVRKDDRTRTHGESTLMIRPSSFGGP